MGCITYTIPFYEAVSSGKTPPGYEDPTAIVSRKDIKELIYLTKQKIDKPASGLSLVTTSYDVYGMYRLTHTTPPITFGKYKMPITSVGVRSDVVFATPIHKTIKFGGNILSVYGIISDSYDLYQAIYVNDSGWDEKIRRISKLSGDVLGIGVPAAGLIVGGADFLLSAGESLYDKTINEERKKDAAKLLEEYESLLNQIKEDIIAIEIQLLSCP